MKEYRVRSGRRRGGGNGADCGRRVPARNQHFCAAACDLGGFRARGCVAGLCPRARADRCGRGVQHPDRRRRQDIAGIGTRPCAALLVLGAAFLLCRAPRLRDGGRGDARRPRRGRFARRHLSRPARRDGRRTSRGRRGRAVAAHPGARRRQDADRHEPRLSHEHDARDGAARDRNGRLPHLPAYRHGEDRRPGRAIARPPAERPPAALQGLSADRFPHSLGVAMHIGRAGQGHLRTDR